MRPNNIFAIVKKELRTYFDSPTAYIVLVIFLGLWQFLFFRDAFIIAEASIRGLMSYVPWLFLVLIPAITMGSLANERSDGTLEFLLTHPLKGVELIIGKFIAAWLFVGLAMLFIFPVAFSFSRFGDLDWGVVISQYIGSMLLAASFISIGIFVSSLLANQISALLVSVASSFGLLIIGLEIITLSLPGQVASIFENLSALTHFFSLSRGVLDLRDVWYFLSVVIIFIALSYLQLLRLRVGNRKQIYQSYVIATGLFIGIAVLMNIVGARIPGRLDITEEKIYELSPVTKQTLGDLDDVVNIKLYATSELPAQLRPILRDTKDVLRDYELYSNGKVKVEILNPASDDALVREANSLGIREVQFNVIGQEELQLKRGFLGLAVSYGGKNEAIPIINTATDLEYQLTGFIKKLTSDDKKTIGFLVGHGEKDANTDYGIWTQELEKQYEVSPISLGDDENETQLNSGVDALVIAGPTEEIPSKQRQEIAEYFDNGGSVMFLLDGTTINESVLSATANDNSLVDFIPNFGVNLGQDIVFDLRSNEAVNFGGGDGSNYILQYQFWPRVIADTQTNSTLTKQIRSLVLPWPSSLEIDEDILSEKGLKADSLFVTTNYAGSQKGNFNIQPNQESLPSDLGTQTMAVSVIGEESNSDEKTPRAIVVGDSDFLTNNFVTNTPENLAFGIESTAWLSQEQSLAQIQLKQRKQRSLLFQDDTQISLVRYGNMAFALIVPLLIGLVRLVSRNSLRKQKYSYE